MDNLRQSRTLEKVVGAIAVGGDDVANHLVLEFGDVARGAIQEFSQSKGPKEDAAQHRRQQSRDTYMKTISGVMVRVSICNMFSSRM